MAVDNVGYREGRRNRGDQQTGHGNLDHQVSFALQMTDKGEWIQHGAMVWFWFPAVNGRRRSYPGVHAHRNQIVIQASNRIHIEAID